MKSWRTTILGILGGVALMVVQLIAILDNDPATVFSLSQFCAALGMFGIGWFARDNDKTSENVGAK